MMGWDILAVAVLLALSAFFSASETALTALDPVRTQRLIDKGTMASKVMELWRDQPLRVLTCILIGNNIVNITASVMTDHLAERLLEGTSYADTSAPLAIGIMTFLVLTFGEIVPKTVAKARSEQLAGRMMLALRLPLLLFMPLTAFFTRLTSAIMSLSGDDPNAARPKVTEEDIGYMVELSSRDGNIDHEQKDRLQSVIELSTTKVREIMIPRIEMVAVEKSMSLQEVLDKLLTSGHSRLPVYDDTIDNVVGLFYAKDMLRYMQSSRQDGGSFSIEPFVKPAYFVPEAKKASDLLSEFQKGHIHMAIVVGEFGGVSGLITLEDIVEEVFGDIQDEHDSEEDYHRVLGEGHLMAAGRCPLYMLEEILDVTFPEHPEYDSLGGFVLAQTGRLPEVGTSFRHGDHIFTVTDADAKRVIEVEIVQALEISPPSAHGFEQGSPLRRLAG